MGIMLGGFDRMGEGDSKKMQKLVLNRAKTNQTRDWPYLSQFLDFCHGCGCLRGLIKLLSGGISL